MYYIIIGILIGADQIIKKIVVNNMDLQESIPVIGDFFRINYIQNTGAAFSILENAKMLLIIAPVILIIAALIYIFKKRKSSSPVLLWALSLIAAGGLGNVIDRIFLGYVVDYLSFGSFAIFNFADVCVCTGCGLLIIYIIFIEGKRDKTKG